MGRQMQKGVLNNKDMEYTYSRIQVDMPSMYMSRRAAEEKAPGERKGEKFMADKIFENNQVSMVGEIVSDFTFSHEVYGEGFYMVEIAVNRLSNYMDYIPVSYTHLTLPTTERV